MQRILYMNVSILENSVVFHKWMNIISDDRRKKVEKMKNPTAARLSLGAGILLHLSLEKSGYSDYSEKMKEGAYGKPYLSDPGFYFSLSHSGTYAICVYGDEPVGVDLQKIKDSIPKYLDRVLTIEEKCFLDSLVESKKKNIFYRIWAKKESLIKWDGRGLRIPLHEISTIESGVSVKQLIFEGKTVYIKELDILMPDYSIAVCTEKENNIQEIIEVDLNVLTKY